MVRVMSHDEVLMFLLHVPHCFSTVSKLLYTAARQSIGVKSVGIPCLQCSASGQADKHGRTPLSVAAPVSVAWPLAGCQRTVHCKHAGVAAERSRILRAANSRGRS